MWAEFDRLRCIWSARQEGSGGVAALKGFQFQLAAALLELARKSAEPNRPRVFVEALSDMVSAEGGYLIVTQVKLSLHSAAFQKALKELWEINALAATKAKKLLPHLRYCVLTSAKILKDIESALARWHPGHPVGESELEAFRVRVSVRVEADPQLTLAIHLVNAFDDPSPFANVEKWLGRLLANPTKAGFEESCRSILVELDGLAAAARERAHRFYIWQSQDRPPSEPRLEIDPEKATLTGQLPTRTHLFEGRFAPRAVYKLIHHDVETWFTRHKDRNDPRLPVWWISGPSGTGKSVALLHLLVDLHGEDDQRVIVWLDEQADRLAEAVRWARPFFAGGHDIIFASDDPYTAERSQRVSAAFEDALREVESILVAYPNAPRPFFVCCGPTEQKEYFENDLLDRVLVESQSPALVESLDDIDSLKEWYRRRTGRTDLPVGDAANVLIVQLFFEWATGKPLREFALRFRERLEGMEQNKSSTRKIFDLIAEILALNRLYALFPAQSIHDELESDPELGAAFDRLRHLERHLSFDAGKAGYRLTHPHLANAIYITWFGGEHQRRHRKAHLRAGVDAALKSGDTPSRRLAPLWAIARLTSDRTRGSSETRERIALIEPELCELLVDIYEHQFAESESPLTDLPVWADLDWQLNLNLRPRPIRRIGSAACTAAERSPGLRLSCHKLLQHRGSLPEAASIVALLLQEHPTWHEWAPVAVDYSILVGLADIEGSVREFLAREWFRPAARTLIEACFAQLDRAIARRAILSWLQAAPTSDRAWPGYFTRFADVFEFCGIINSLAWRFLHDQPGHSSWSHVWERLHDASISDGAKTVTLAKCWLNSAKPEISGWDRVWETLWKESDKSDDELRARGRKWLDDVAADHGSWGFVWLALWQAQPDDDLRARGRKWLDDVAADHGSWTFVWETLWQAQPDDDLRARGRKWLDDVAADYGSWTFVWLALWKQQPNDDLQALARGWLPQAPDTVEGSKYVWQELWQKSDKADVELRILGSKWLVEDITAGPAAQAHPYQWKDAWEIQWNDAAGDPSRRDALAKRAKEWLGEFDLKQQGWTSVWRILWEQTSTDESLCRLDLAALAEGWLQKVDPKHPRWPGVWLSLWDTARECSSAERNSLSLIGRDWLVGKEKRVDWQLVWSELWKIPDLRDDTLRTIALSRLHQLTSTDRRRIEDRLLDP